MDTVADFLSTPSHGHRTSLVVQGGGMRGVYSMAALAALDEAGLGDAFDVIVGSSAGAINGAYFLAGQASDAVDLYVEHLSNRHFVNAFRLHRIVDIDFLVDVALKQYLPLDVEKVHNSRTLLEIVVTNAETAQPEVVTNRDLQYDFYEVIRATAALPSLYNKRVRLGNGLYVDGGTVDAIPLARAVDKGADRILTVITRHPGYRRLTHGRFYRLVGRALARGQSPAIRNLIGRADPLLNEAMAMLEGEPGNAGVFQGWCVWPSDESKLVGRATADKVKLRECASMGRRDMMTLLDSKLEEVRSERE